MFELSVESLGGFGKFTGFKEERIYFQGSVKMGSAYCRGRKENSIDIVNIERILFHKSPLIQWASLYFASASLALPRVKTQLLIPYRTRRCDLNVFSSE